MNRMNLDGRNWLWQKILGKSTQETVPKHCDFCATEIKSEDLYWLGYDRYNIFANTCDNFHCKKWLEHKVIRKKE